MISTFSEIVLLKLSHLLYIVRKHNVVNFYVVRVIAKGHQRNKSNDNFKCIAALLIHLS